MSEFRVKSFHDLHEVLGRYRRDVGWVFRGHADAGWTLVPRAGRPPFADGHDLIFFNRWKADAWQYLDHDPGDEWEWLATAALSGFPTRLLGWAFKPLYAAYFAVAERSQGDSVIYALKTRNVLTDPAGESPFKHQGIIQFTPRRSLPGVSRQIAVFTLHGPPSLSLESRHDADEKLEKIVIDRSYRRELRFELNQYGINRPLLFPDLRNLSRHFNWIQASFSYWAEGARSVQGGSEE